MTVRSRRLGGFPLAPAMWVLLPLLVIALVPIAKSAAQDDPDHVELGEAPFFDESQDTTGWLVLPRPKAAKTRDQVAQLYTRSYVPGSSVPLHWMGSVSGCNPGTTNLEHQQAVLDRVGYFRALVDLPAVTLLSGMTTAQAQAAALMMTANNALSHFPPMTWLCYSADGASGAASSNIALGLNGVRAMDIFMDDFGPNNTAVGHRRWILFPPRAAMATGDTVGAATTFRSANSLFVFGPTNTRPATPNGVAWPPAGFVPYQNLPAKSNRWSWSYPGADFTSATVTVTGPGGPIPVTLETPGTGFGDNTLVFLPAGIPYAKPAADTTYTIKIAGITGSGVPSSTEYSVTVIDPAVAGPVPVATVDVVEFYNAVLDHYFITWIAAEIAILDAGTTIKGWARTGRTFKAYATLVAGTSEVCRYYIPPGLGDSHFFGRGQVECDDTGRKNPSFVLEEPRFMYLFLPTAGACPANTVQVHRAFTNRRDANHRYITSKTDLALMVTRGWLAEGDGPDLVVMCSPV